MQLESFYNSGSRFLEPQRGELRQPRATPWVIPGERTQPCKGHLRGRDFRSPLQRPLRKSRFPLKLRHPERSEARCFISLERLARAQSKDLAAFAGKHRKKISDATKKRSEQNSRRLSTVFARADWVLRLRLGEAPRSNQLCPSPSLSRNDAVGELL